MSRKAGIALLLVLTCCACGGDQPRLPQIPPPADLAELDPPVQQQYEQLRGTLQRLGEEKGVTGSELGATYGALGMWYHAYQYEDTAALCYEVAGRLDSDPRWPYFQAILQERKGEYQGARQAFSLSLQRSTPAAPTVLVRLAEVELQLGDYEAAARHLQQALAADPSCAQALLGLGKVALAQGDAETAVARLEQAHALQPGATPIAYSLGQAYQRLGRVQRAQELLAQVPQLSRDHRPVVLDDPWMSQVTRLRQGARVLTRKGLAAFDQERYLLAAELFGRSLAIDPDSLQTRINYALALEKTGRFVAARQQLEEVLRRDDDHAGAHLALGSLLTALSDHHTAEQHLQAALAINPSAEVHLSLGRLLQVSGRLEEALQHYRQVRQMGEPATECRLWHGVLLTWLDRHGEALAALRQDLELLPDEEMLLLLEARLLAASPDSEVRDRAMSLQIARRIVTASPTVCAAETMAMALAENGRFAEASAWQRAVLTTAELRGLHPAAARARRRLALYQDHKPCRSPWDRTEYPVPFRVEPPA